MIPHVSKLLIRTPSTTVFLVILVFAISTFADDVDRPEDVSKPAVTWAKTFGGQIDDRANSIAPTSDGGFIVAGSTKSKGGGRSDIWVIKLDGSGEIEWEKTFGKKMNDYGYGAAQTTDGGYCVAGKMDTDFYALKLNGTGDVVWEKKIVSFGYGEYAYPAEDGGCIVEGTYESENHSTNEKVPVCSLQKIDKSGNTIFVKGFGYCTKLSLLEDGTVVASGYLQEEDHGIMSINAFIMRFDTKKEFWRNTIHEKKICNKAFTLGQTSDGGYILPGASSDRTWVAKYDASGTQLWKQDYGHKLKGVPLSVEQTSDGGFIMRGIPDTIRLDSSREPSKFNKIVNALSPNAPREEYEGNLLFKLDADGNLEWTKTFEDLGPGYMINSIREMPGGGYIIAGIANYKSDNEDAWVARIDESGNCIDRSSK